MYVDLHERNILHRSIRSLLFVCVLSLITYLCPSCYWQRSKGRAEGWNTEEKLLNIYNNGSPHIR